MPKRNITIAKNIFASVLIMAFFAAVVPALAQVNPLTNLNSAAAGTGLQNISLAKFIGNAIKALLGMLGVLFLLLIIWAGFQWMTAMGDPAKVDKAKKIIFQSTAGVVIIFVSYAITTYVIDALNKSLK